MSGKPTLLLLSSQLDIKRWVRKIVEDEFYLLEEVSCSQALLSCQTTRIDYILIDFAFDDSVLSFCKKLKAESHLESTPILLISDKLNLHFQEETLQAGVSGLILPFSDKKSFLEKLQAAQKSLQTQKKISSLPHSFSHPPASSAASLKNKVIWNEDLLEKMQKISREKITSLILIVEVDMMAEYGKEEWKEMNQICLEEWKKNFSEQEVLFPVQEGKFLSLFLGENVSEIEKKAKNFQAGVHNRSLSSPHHRNFSLSLCFMSAKEVSLPSKEKLSSFFDHILSRAEKTFKQSHEKKQFISFDLQG